MFDSGFTTADYWVGATQSIPRINVFRCNDGTFFNTNLWAVGEPNRYMRGGAKCVEMLSSGDNYKFGDDACGRKQDYICESE